MGAHAASGMHNADLAAAFEEMSELLAIRGDNPFRIRAYQRAAQVIRSQPRSLAELPRSDWTTLPGIGVDLARKLGELLRCGTFRALEQARARVPAHLRELLQVPGLGPVRVRTLYGRLGVTSREDLARALQTGKVGELPGFGPVLQRRLEAALAAGPGPTRWPLAEATQYGEALRSFLLSCPGITHVEMAGSYRRGRDTVGDLDFVVCAGRGFDLAAALRRCRDVRGLQAAGPTRCTAVLRNGLQVDLRLIGEESLGAALLYFTGSREHNLRLRRRAQERGLKLNEYGLYRGAERIAGHTEVEVYAALGLPLIPVELREDRGEIAAAARGQLPKLVEQADLKGDLHMHTDASDGHDSLEAMVAAAQARGLQYCAITDHSRHLGIVHGLDAGRLSQQIDAIDALNATLRDFVVLKGVEVDILEDGRLALPQDLLRRLDVVVAAIHGHFDLPQRAQTTRILRALEHPCVNILAHPTARLIGRRAPCAMDFGKVLAAARARSCCLELDSQPARLDLDDVMCKAARDSAVLISIASDAHSAVDLELLAGGIRQARRGWLTAEDVVNTRPLPQLRRLLARSRG